jgi:hypothetical protein
MSATAALAHPQKPQANRLVNSRYLGPFFVLVSDPDPQQIRIDLDPQDPDPSLLAMTLKKFSWMRSSRVDRAPNAIVTQQS